MKDPVKLIVTHSGQTFSHNVPRWVTRIALEALESAKRTGKPQEFGSILLKEEALEMEVRLGLGATASLIYPDTLITIEEIDFS